MASPILGAKQLSKMCTTILHYMPYSWTGFPGHQWSSVIEFLIASVLKLGTRFLWNNTERYHKTEVNEMSGNIKLGKQCLNFKESVALEGNGKISTMLRKVETVVGSYHLSRDAVRMSSAFFNGIGPWKGIQDFLISRQQLHNLSKS